MAAPFVRPETRRLGVASGSALLEVGCHLLSPWPLALAVDHAIGGLPLTGPLAFLSGLGDAGLLVVAGFATLLLRAAGGLLEVCTEVNAERAAERIGGALRKSFFSRALSLSLRWHDRMRTGDLVSRMTTDVDRILDVIVAMFTTLLPDLLLLAGVLTVLIGVDPLLAVLGLVVMPVLALLTVRMRRRVREVSLDAREAGGWLSAVVTDLFRNVRAIQAFGRPDSAEQSFGEPNARAVETSVRAAITEARWGPVPDVVLGVGAALVLVVGGLQVLGGALTVGGLLVVLFYLENLEDPVENLVRLSATRARAAVSAQRLREVLDSTEAIPVPAVPRPMPAVRTGLRLDKVSFSYEPGRPVLDRFDLAVAAGETVCLFGPSGAGKSTVLSLLLRLYDPDAGRVLVDGVDVRELAPQDLRRQLAFVPQDPWLLDATIAENIAFGRAGATRAQVLEAGRAAWVDEFALTLPEGYDTPLGENGILLSGGQRRRVALARAVISPAPVVLLDEPTTSLDAEAAQQVVGAIRFATRDRTVLLVTHDPVLAAIADRTVHVTPLRSAALRGAGAAIAGSRSGAAGLDEEDLDDFDDEDLDDEDLDDEDLDEEDLDDDEDFDIPGRGRR
jgi:ABC-type multidrug transport system fused ATPase/permease subunit